MVELMTQWGEPVGMFIACLLTIAVLSYLIGDNALFRLVSHIFIGLITGYITVLVVYGVIWQQLILPLWDARTGSLNIAVPFGLAMGAILLIGRSAAWSRPVVAYLVGVGVATAIGGALLGTIVPQVAASANLFAPGKSITAMLTGIFVVVGTITTLIYFNFRARAVGDLPTKRLFWIDALGWIGQFFITATFGVLFASVFTAALTAFVQRWYFLWNYFLENLLGFFPFS